MSPAQIGIHVSSAQSLDLAFDRAAEVGCTTFQMFTRSPQMWACKPLSEETVAAFRAKRRESGFKTVVDHMPYLPNLASSDKALMKKSRESLNAEINRCDSLGIDCLVAHVGSHMGKGSMVGVRNVAEACRLALDQSAGGTTLLVENTAGQANAVGTRFEELAQIISIAGSERLEVCFDTCHAFAAGFDLSTQDGVDRTLDLFGDIVGLDKMRVIHLNDSKGPLGGNLDRHEFIGRGRIGPRGFRAFLHANGVSSKPLIMETPFKDTKGMRESLATVRKLLG